MPLLESADAALFRFVNLDLSNPFLDTVMPWFSSNPFFFPIVFLISIGLLWKGGTHGRLFVLLLVVILALGDSFVINTLKHAVGRLRPFHSIAEAHFLVGKGSSGSMPSSHTSTWCAAMLIAYAFYPRSWRYMLPLALAMAFSRIYLGAHYPSDVFVGAILGAGYGAAGLLGFNWLWQFAGQRWFPLWWQRRPALTSATQPILISPADTQGYWLKIGYVFIAMVAFGRLIYLAAGAIELSEDEAYQWLWSKHLALSYYSKPPMIAYLQFVGTALWGDNEFGVRFFSPVIGGIISLLTLRFITRVADARAAFWLVVAINCAPLLAVGSTLMTIDPPLVLFWTAATVAGWRAVQPNSSTRDWLWVGVWMGLAGLSKYSALFQIVCWMLFFCVWPPARARLKRLGPWVALCINAVCLLPVLVWNAQHNWVTIQHVAYNAGRSSAWKPAANFLLEFLGAETALLNPFFLVAAVWAMCAFWTRSRREPLTLFLFSMGVPVFLGYMAFTAYKRVFPNWIAPAVLPMFFLAAIYWHRRWQEGCKIVQLWLAGGIALGGLAVVLLHNTDLTQKMIGRTLPPAMDPLRRVRAWHETAKTVSLARAKLENEGKPAFIIGDHYGITGELAFYLHQPGEVYYKTTSHPKNQFYFWPGYRHHRTGQNAIFVKETGLPVLQRGWFLKWIAGDKNVYTETTVRRPRPPAELLDEFDSVSDLGVVDILYKGRIFRRLQLFACRNLRE